MTAVRLDPGGNIVIDLAYGEGQVGGGTLGYIVSKGRNVMLDLVYTITQNAPIALRNHRSITISSFVQGRLSDPEVDAFSYHISDSGMKYRLYSPGHGRGSRPPDAAGSRSSSGCTAEARAACCPTTTTTTRRRCGPTAVRWASPPQEAQRIFGGAYVVAPQSTSYWIEDGPRFAPLIREIIGDLVRRYPIDRERIYVAGCSNGGYMTHGDDLGLPRPVRRRRADLRRRHVPRAGRPTAAHRRRAEAIDTPTWLVASRDDTTVPPEPNTIHAHDLIPGSLMTLYDHVIWNGHQFPGHWSWIYVARNDPTINGTHIWQWMAQQRR